MNEPLDDELRKAESRKRLHGRIVLTVYLVIVLSLTIAVCVMGLNAMRFHSGNSKSPTTELSEQNTNK